MKKRKNTAIIFGNIHQKEILYKDILQNQSKYHTLLKEMGIIKIIDIGPKIDISKKISFLNITRVGVRPKNNISLFLKNSRAGLVFYPVSQMTKSGIVAAYASHGLVIINFCEQKIIKTNEFISGIHYVSKIKKNQAHIFQKIANESFKNYKKYALHKTTSLIINNLKKN